MGEKLNIPFSSEPTSQRDNTRFLLERRGMTTINSSLNQKGEKYINESIIGSKKLYKISEKEMK